jgi:hypothetical protein
MTQIELTQAELDLIQAKRDEELAQQQKHQQRINERIAAAEQSIIKAQTEDAKQMNAARSFLQELGAGWTESIQVRPAMERVYDDVSDVVWSKEYFREEVYLQKDDYKVDVRKHIVYRDKWSRGGTDKGYKMYLRGPEIEWAYEQKALSKADTVNSKILECVNQIAAREHHKKQKISAVETTVLNLQTKYPTATITATKEWRTTKYNKSGYQEYDNVNIQFINGVQMSYEVYANGTISRTKILFGKVNDYDLMDVLSNITLPTAE